MSKSDLSIPGQFVSNTPILTSIPTVEQFKSIIQNNKGTIIIKFGADWCGPCRLIDKQVHQWFDYCSQNKPLVQTYLLDVDNNFDVYGFLKKNRVVNGVPVILVYKSENNTFRPDDLVIGAKSEDIDALFRRNV